MDNHGIVGKEFSVTIPWPNLAAQECLIAEFSGPSEEADDPESQTTLSTLLDESKPRGDSNDKYVLRGPVCDETQVGTYYLTSLTRHNMGTGAEKPIQDKLPGISVKIDPYQPKPVPPSPSQHPPTL
jgi:hypothetical protein